MDHTTDSYEAPRPNISTNPHSEELRVKQIRPTGMAMDPVLYSDIALLNIKLM